MPLEWPPLIVPRFRHRAHTRGDSLARAHGSGDQYSRPESTDCRSKSALSSASPRPSSHRWSPWQSCGMSNCSRQIFISAITRAWTESQAAKLAEAVVVELWSRGHFRGIDIYVLLVCRKTKHVDETRKVRTNLAVGKKKRCAE